MNILVYLFRGPLVYHFSYCQMLPPPRKSATTTTTTANISYQLFFQPPFLLTIGRIMILKYLFWSQSSSDLIFRRYLLFVCHLYEWKGWQRWGTNRASRRIFLLNHASRRIISLITWHVKRFSFRTSLYPRESTTSANTKLIFASNSLFQMMLKSQTLGTFCRWQVTLLFLVKSTAFWRVRFNIRREFSRQRRHVKRLQRLLFLGPKLAHLAIQKFVWRTLR